MKQKTQECFVIMPFGTKQPSLEAQTYDFDLIYKRIIRPAANKANLIPIRADEQSASGVVHTELFRGLRDSRIVVADLSMGNANVFYELGIRHVLARASTVLICCRNFPLPFDVNLARVIIYEFDGRQLDDTEANEAINRLTAALRTAETGLVDSPVHTLLGSVFPQGTQRPELAKQETDVQAFAAYQRALAAYWIQTEAPWPQLLKEHENNTFGARALAYLWLEQVGTAKDERQLAKTLFGLEQYDLATELYDALDQRKELGVTELRNYGSAISELRLDSVGAKRGLRLIQDSIGLAEERIAKLNLDIRALPRRIPQEGQYDVIEAGKSYVARSSMRLWMWELSGDASDLENALKDLEEALSTIEQTVVAGADFPPSRLALLYFRKMLLLRHQSSQSDEEQQETLKRKVLQVHVDPTASPRYKSWLEWIQAVVIAESGDEAQAKQCGLRRLLADARLVDSIPDIGRRQYTSIRREVDRHWEVLVNPAFVGEILQLLELGTHGLERDALAELSLLQS